MMIDDVRSRIKHSVLPGSAVRHCAAGVLATAGSTGLLLLLLLHFLRYVPVQVILASPATIGIDELVSVVVTGCGVLLAAWYTLSAAGGTLCAGARLLGSTWHAGERLLRRRGAPGVARLLGAGSGAVLAASLALVPAQAASPPGPDAPAAEDLSWGAEQNTAADPPAQVQQSPRATPQQTSRQEGQERSRSEPPEHSRAQEPDEADTPPAHAAPSPRATRPPRHAPANPPPGRAGALPVRTAGTLPGPRTGRGRSPTRTRRHRLYRSDGLCGAAG